MSDNPSAFPYAAEYGHPAACGGMTLRDYFAGQALAHVIDAYVLGNGPCLGSDHMPKNCAIHAYRIADAMLAARTGGA